MSGHHHGAAVGPNVNMRMSPEAKAAMRAIEKDVYRYYNDMGKQKGNCTWGPGILAHKAVCDQDELKKKVDMKLIDLEFERRVAEAERLVRVKTKIVLNQAQFDALASLTFNAGLKATRDTYEFINQGDFAGAAANISKLIKVEVNEGGKKKYVIAPGLIKRRAQESAPFRAASPATSATTASN